MVFGCLFAASSSAKERTENQTRREKERNGGVACGLDYIIRCLRHLRVAVGNDLKSKTRPLPFSFCPFSPLNNPSIKSIFNQPFLYFNYAYNLDMVVGNLSKSVAQNQTHCLSRIFIDGLEFIFCIGLEFIVTYIQKIVRPKSLKPETYIPKVRPTKKKKEAVFLKYITVWNDKKMQQTA